ncbi:MAG: CoA-transferase subunit beta [Vulcanimicrobiaceae bacterium]
MNPSCTMGEAMIYALARTIEDGSLVFHGYGSPLVQIAMHVAKRTHAPNMVLVEGATYGVNPTPLFITPVSNDRALDRGAEATLEIGELFDLAASGRMGRMFLSGIQIDRFGNANVTMLGRDDRVGVKLPGGGGGCNLSCDARHLTLWTTGHRAPPDAGGRRRYRLVERCDFVTNLGNRAPDGRTRSTLRHRGGGAQWLVTELAVFDFDENGELRVRELYPDTTLADVMDHTEFEPHVAIDVRTMPLPPPTVVAFIRALDPLGIHRKELREADLTRSYDVPEALVTR